MLSYGTMAGGLIYSLAFASLLALGLLAALLLWLAAGAARGRIVVRARMPAVLFAALLGWAVFSSLRAGDRLAGLTWCALLGTYGLAGFLVMRLGEDARRRRFLLACFVATGVALAAYALGHYALYMPAVRQWLASDPAFVRAATGAGDGLGGDLADRIRANRAYGSFITSNQLAGFLAMVGLLLAGMGLARLRRRDACSPPGRRAALAAMAGALLVVAVAFALARSKGGFLALGCGIGAFALAWGVSSRTRLLVLAALVLAACGLMLAFGPERMARSLGVRAGYWRASVEMIRREPVTGVGPGSWAEWYSRLKRPEDEDSRAAHSAHLQVAAETGLVGGLLWCALWAAVLVPALRRKAPAGAAPEAVEGPGPGDVRLLGIALGAAALMLGFDYAAMGTFAPPRHVPAWLAGAPWLPYAALYGVWAVAFTAAFLGRPAADGRLLRAGATAGLAAFLVHSAGEFTLSVPAIGLAAAFLAGMLLTRQDGGAALGPRASRAALAIAAAALVAWGALVTRPALAAALALDAADRLRVEVLTGGRGRGALASRAGEMMRHYRRACEAVPWDDRAWRQRAAAALWLARVGLEGDWASEALAAAERAAALNPPAPSNWSVLGEARRLAGETRRAADALRRAAERAPTLPAAWLAYAVAAQDAGETPAARAAYRQVLALMPRQYHARNRVPGPPVALAEFWTQATGEPPAGSLLELAVDVAARAGAVPLPRDLGEQATVAALLRGQASGAQLVRDWPALGREARERRLWRALGPQLWRWMIEGTVAGMAPEDGASGGI